MWLPLALFWNCADSVLAVGIVLIQLAVGITELCQVKSRFEVILTAACFRF